MNAFPEFCYRNDLWSHKQNHFISVPIIQRSSRKKLFSTLFLCVVVVVVLFCTLIENLFKKKSFFFIFCISCVCAHRQQQQHQIEMVKKSILFFQMRTLPAGKFISLFFTCPISRESNFHRQHELQVISYHFINFLWKKFNFFISCFLFIFLPSR